MTPTRGSPGPSWVNLGAAGQPVDQGPGVRHLVVERVQRDLSGGVAEAAGRVGQDDEPARARSSASETTDSLEPPNPWATITAGAGVLAGR